MKVLNVPNSFVTMRSRVERFINSPSKGRDEVASLIDHLRGIGRVAIFGGMLRDICLDGTAHFASDVDLVVDSESPDSLRKALDRYRPGTTTLGGSRIQLGRWKADVWNLTSTWAFKEGVVTGCTFQDLCRTTFFDWDAVVYEVDTRIIYAIDSYLNRLEDGVIEINLEINPNPLGVTVRTLRLLAKRIVSLGPRLAAYLWAHLQASEASTICAAEQRRYDVRLLTPQFVLKVLREVSLHLEVAPDKPFRLREQQLELFPAKHSAQRSISQGTADTQHRWFAHTPSIPTNPLQTTTENPRD